MMIWTHTTFSLFMASFLLYISNVTIDVGVLLFVFLGNMLPDIDHPGSVLGSVFVPISKFIDSQFGHRSVAHSFLFLAGCGVLFYPLTWVFEFKLYVALLLGVLGHIMGDEITVTGVQWWWPSKTACIAWKDIRWRISTGSKEERVLFIILLCLNLAFLPMFSWGMRVTLYHIDKGLEKAVWYARVYYPYNKIYVTLDADWMQRGSQIEDWRVFEIIGIQYNSCFIRDMSDRRTVYWLSGKDNGSAMVRQVFIKLGPPVRRYSVSRNYTADQPFEMAFLSGQQLDDVFVNGTLAITGDMTGLQDKLRVLQPSVEAQPTIEAKPNSDGSVNLVISRATASLLDEILVKGNVVAKGHLDFLITEPDQKTRVTDILHLRLFQ